LDGETTKTISLKFTNDLIAEPNETFNVTLSDPSGGAIIGTPSSMTVTILDNDGGGAGYSSSSSSSSAGSTNSSAAGGSIGFSATAYSTYESTASATITVLRKGNTSNEAKVNYATSDGSATAGIQYTAATGTLTFAAGESSKTFSVPLFNNSSIDGNKSVTIKLSNPTNSAVLGNPSQVTLTIVDDEATPVGSGSISFSTDVYTARERDGSTLITVIKRGGFDVRSSVQFTTYDSTAIAGSDYTSTSGTMTFEPGESSRYFTIPFIVDSVTENEERISMQLSSPSGGVLGTQVNSVVNLTD
jgi:hypothetical protein